MLLRTDLHREGLRQPVGPVTLNRRHALARGLIYSAYNCLADIGKPPRDYVMGAIGTLIGTSRSVARLPSGPLMAAQTYNGTSADKCTAALSLVPYQTILVTFWMWWDAFATDDKLAGIYGTSVTTQTGFYIDPNSGLGAFLVSTFSNNTFSRYTFTRPSAAAWHHYGFLFDLTAATQQFAEAYVDGLPVVRSVQTQTQAAGATFSKSTLSMMWDQANTLFSAGRMMNFNIYNATGGQVAQTVSQLYRAPWAMFSPVPMYAFPTAPVSSFVAHRFELAS